MAQHRVAPGLGHPQSYPSPVNGTGWHLGDVPTSPRADLGDKTAGLEPAQERKQLLRGEGWRRAGTAAKGAPGDTAEPPQAAAAACPSSWLCPHPAQGRDSLGPGEPRAQTLLPKPQGGCRELRGTAGTGDTR